MTDSPNDGDPQRELCKQCAFLFSTPGIRHLRLGEKEKHWQHPKIKISLLETFPDRLQCCRFCRYLWNEDLVGASLLNSRFRRLRDLVLVAPGQPQPSDLTKFQGSLVVVTDAGKHVFRPTGDPAQYLELDHEPEWGFEFFTIRVESASGRMLWTFPFLYVARESSEYLPRDWT